MIWTRQNLLYITATLCKWKKLYAQQPKAGSYRAYEYSANFLRFLDDVTIRKLVAHSFHNGTHSLVRFLFVRKLLSDRGNAAVINPKTNPSDNFP